MLTQPQGFLVLSQLTFLLLSVFKSSLLFQQGWQFLALFGDLVYGYRRKPALDPALT